MTKPSDELFSCFRVEATELIDGLTRGCLALEKADYEAELFDGLNRFAHSLKGAARLVELFRVSELAHALEDAFGEMSGRASGPTADEVSGLLGQVDELKQLVEAAIAVKDQRQGQADSPAAAEDHSPRQPEESTTREREPKRARRMSEPVAPDKGAHGSVPLMGTDGESARVSTRTLEGIGRCSGEVLELTGRMDRLNTHLRRMRHLALSAANVVDAAQKGGRLETEPGCLQAAGHKSSRTAIDTSELRSCAENIFRESDGVLSVAKPLGLRLHGLALEARTDTVDELTPRFERLVRDVAKELGREVEFEIGGSDVRVDRHVLQRLTDPVCHLLRNAIAHGIESADVRLKLNKPPAGKVRLWFEKRADSLRVVVEDDGAGLDAEAIRQAARTTSSSDPTDGDQLPDEDISDLIFRPGVTTERETSQVSGRGVGLDVVRTAARKLRGAVSVESEPRRFCRFTINVPSNLDVMNVFVLRVAEQDLLVPMTSLEKTCMVKRGDIVNHGGTEAILVDKRPVRLVSLQSLLNLPQIKADSEAYEIAVLDVGERRFAVTVDSLQGKQRAVIKGTGPLLSPCEALAGAAIMSDGRPGFLLDTEVLAKLANDSRFAVRHAGPSKSVRRKSVLVVDDSLTTRMLEKAVLEAVGYRVLMACDATEALESLGHTAADLVVIDYEMPGMDGVELARAIQENPKLSDIPLMMLTSRSGDEDKRKGLAAGFRAYLVKGQFDQTVFLNTVQGLIGDAEDES